MVATKNKRHFIEESVVDQHVFKFDTNCFLKDQVLYEDENHYLLNVLKLYTNNIYFGMQVATLDKEQQDIQFIFRCKDRGYPENLVDDKNRFMQKYKDVLVRNQRDIKNWQNPERFYSKPAKFLQKYGLTFWYDRHGNYVHSTAIIFGAPARGAYGSEDPYTREAHLEQFGYAIYNREPTEKEVKEYLIDRHISALSNHITRENTAYSTIKVFHKTEI